MMKMMKMNAVAKEEAKATAAEAAEAKRAEEARANAEARRMAEEAARKAAFEAAEARKADFEAEKARKAFEAVKVIMRHGFALRSLQIIIRARILVLNFRHSRTSILGVIDDHLHDSNSNGTFWAFTRCRKLFLTNEIIF